MEKSAGAPIILEYPTWTPAERHLVREALEEHYETTATGPFGAYDPTGNGTLLEAELVRRGWHLVTCLYHHSGSGAEWHECTIERPGARTITVRAPTFDQAVAMAAIEALRS